MGYVCHIDKVNTSHGIRKGKQTNGKFCIRAFTGVVVVYNHSNIVFRYGSIVFSVTPLLGSHRLYKTGSMVQESRGKQLQGFRYRDQNDLSITIKLS